MKEIRQEKEGRGGGRVRKWKKGKEVRMERDTCTHITHIETYVLLYFPAAT